MNDAENPARQGTAPSDASVATRRRLLQLGAIAVPAVVTLSATPALAQVVSSSTCIPNPPTNVCYRADGGTADPTTLVNSGGSALTDASQCTTATPAGTYYNPPPSGTTREFWQQAATSTSSEQQAWVAYLRNPANAGQGYSCFTSLAPL